MVTPGSVTVSLRGSFTCIGTPARLPDPRPGAAGPRPEPARGALRRQRPAPRPNSTFPGKGDPELRDWRCGTSQTLAVAELGPWEGPAACWEL